MFWMRGMVTVNAAHALDAADFGILAQAAVARLPQIFRAHLVDVVFPIEEFADEATFGRLGLENGWGLTGLY